MQLAHGTITSVMKFSSVRARQRSTLLDIADTWPVHRTLRSEIVIETTTCRGEDWSFRANISRQAWRRPTWGTSAGMNEVNRKAELGDLSTGELVSQLSEQVSHLVRDELRLAQAELKQKGKQVGIGAGLAGAGGLLSLFGLSALVVAVIAALALVLPVWAAALIVSGVLLLLAGLLALAGIGQVKRGTPLTPDEAIASTKRDIETVKESTKR